MSPMAASRTASIAQAAARPACSGLVMVPKLATSPLAILAAMASALRFSRLQPVRLTATESQLMKIFAACPGEPVSRTRLVEDLGRGGGKDGTAQERAVDVQITRLRRKLEADPKQPRYLQTVRGAGYMLSPD